MSSQEIEDIFTDVLALLKEAVGWSRLNNWGLLTIKDTVREAIDGGETNAAVIARDIIATNNWEDKGE